MSLVSIKPKMVYFQWDHNKLPEFLKMHMVLHLKCLSVFFDVTLINYDCNYREICDLYHPDLALFESGYKSLLSRKPIIKETNSNPHVPKIGLHNGDSWCDCRVGFIADMEKWGVETFFTIGTTMAESTPGVAENLFVWPNFIDSDVFYDYGELKSIPILFNGMRNSLYPWRNKIYDITVKEFPSVISPHTGYEKNSSGMIYGDNYARAINASHFVPACGTLAKEVVRKHFEIPGANACLITEKSASLEAAGFVDMQNCVFADENDILYKLDFLFKNTDVLNKITLEGFSLVHSKHTLEFRDQILQWYRLNKSLNYGEKIIQPNPFGPLSIVKVSSGIASKHVQGKGIHLALLSHGDRCLWSGKYDEAESNYLKCLELIFWMSEPKLKLAICYLLKGETSLGLYWVLNPIQQNLGSYSNAFSPDPIEWAYLIIALLCNGKEEEALFRANQFPFLFHPELNRARLITSYLLNVPLSDKISLPENSKKPNLSIHQLPQTQFLDWITRISSMFESCDQFNYMEKLDLLIESDVGISDEVLIKGFNSDRDVRISILTYKINFFGRINYLLNKWNVPNRKTGLPAISLYDFSIRLLKWGHVDRLRDLILTLRYTSK